MNLDPRNLLVIHFGQLGDVVLGLPALKAVCEHFPDARRTGLVGVATADIVKMARLFDEVIAVDRVRLLKGNKFKSSAELIKFAFAIRRRRFDLVIDLHSLPETNLLGFISGARHRLFSRRESRSLDRLSNFDPPPPAEDKSVHLSEYYLRVLSPLGISGDPVPFTFDHKIQPSNKPIVGLNPGAGHPSRRWPLESFIELSRKIADSGTSDVEVFLGPEESSLAKRVEEALAGQCSIVRGLPLGQLAERFSRLSCLVSNDTGPMHIAAASGVPIVLLLQDAAPDRYLPLTPDLTVHRGEDLGDIRVSDVFSSVLESLSRRAGHA